MPIYPYTTVGQDGTTHGGRIEAPTRMDAVRELRMQGHAEVNVDLPTAGCDRHVPDAQTDR
jgi:hypothetical protein